MKHQQAVHFLRIAAIIGLLLLSACGNANQPKPVSVDVVRVGVLYPMSGDLANTGQDNQNGAVLAADEINAAGGIQSLGGAKLELVFGDTQGNPDIGAQETERLIQQENVVAVIGAYQSSVTKPATQAAERLETPFIVSMAISDLITERGFQYTFRVCPKAQFYGRDQVLFVKDLGNLAGHPVQRVALLYENTDFGTATSLAQKQAIQENGLEVVAEVSYTAEGATDLSNEVAQALAANPDAILEVTYLNDSILIAQALAAAGATIPLVDAAGGVVYPEYVEQLGATAEGSFTLVEYSKYAAGGEELNARFHERFGADITGNSAYAYQAVYVLADALERAASVDKKQLRAALAATDMPKGPHMILPAERIHFDADGQNEFATLFMAQIQDGELVPVWPAEFAASKVRLNP
ncbi:MAG: ABC transporter substrate-binding protein [Anaerolineales bacterium]